jgi:hypothetical protein
MMLLSAARARWRVGSSECPRAQRISGLEQHHRARVSAAAFRTWPPGLAGKQRIVDAIRLEVAGLRPRNATNRGDVRSDDDHELDLTESEIAHAARHISVGEWWGLARAPPASRSSSCGWLPAERAALSLRLFGV